MPTRAGRPRAAAVLPAPVPTPRRAVALAGAAVPQAPACAGPAMGDRAALGTRTRGQWFAASALSRQGRMRAARNCVHARPGHVARAARLPGARDRLAQGGAAGRAPGRRGL